MSDFGATSEYLKHTMEKSPSARNLTNKLCDAGSFVEFNKFAASDKGSALCCGYGRINDRVVYVYAFNHDVDGGAFTDRDTRSMIDLINKAKSTGTPLIGMIHCDGLRLNLGLDAADGWGRIIKASAEISGKVPHIVYVAGAAVGLVGLFSETADVVLLDKNAYVSVGVAAKDVLTSSDCAKSGTVSALTDESNVYDDIKRVLSYFPDNSYTPHEGFITNDDINRKCAGLDSNTSMKDVVMQVFDNGSFYELYSEYGKDIISGFASIGGVCVCVVANSEPVISAEACCKASKLVKIANAYTIPVVVLCNAEGFDLSDPRILAYASDLSKQFSTLSAAFITVITGSAIGSSYVLMGSKGVGADIVYAWPDAVIGLMDAKSAVAVSCDDELNNCEDPLKQRSEIEDGYKKEKMNPYVAAQLGLIDQPILPEDTRAYIAAAVDCMINKNVYN